MKQTRKKYDPTFKAKVAIEAIKERETLNELSAKYEVSPVMISRWKKEFIDNSAAAFSALRTDDVALEKQKDRFLRKIGDLEMQLDFAKRVSKKLGIEIPADD
jgi:transposase